MGLKILTSIVQTFLMQATSEKLELSVDHQLVRASGMWSKVGLIEEAKLVLCDTHRQRPWLASVSPTSAIYGPS